MMNRNYSASIAFLTLVLPQCLCLPYRPHIPNIHLNGTAYTNITAVNDTTNYPVTTVTVLARQALSQFTNFPTTLGDNPTTSTGSTSSTSTTTVTTSTGTTSSTASTATATNPADLCDATKNFETWEQYDIGGWLEVLSTADQPFSSGLVNTLVAGAPGLAADDWNCTIKNCPESVPFNDTGCSVNNGIYAKNYYALYAVQNFMQYWRNLKTAINDVAMQAPLGGDVPSMVDMFTFTDPPESAAESKVIQGLDITLAVLGALFSVVGIKKGSTPLGISNDDWKATGDNLKLGAAVANTVAWSTEEDSSNDATSVYWANFVNASSVITNQQTVMVQAIEDFTYSVAFATPQDAASPGAGAGTAYEYNATQLPQLLMDGAFAEPPQDITNDSDTRMNILAGLSSLAINNLWNYDEVVVVRATKESLGGSVDPCTDSKNFQGNAFWCDSNGTISGLMRWPTTTNIDAIYNSGLTDRDQFYPNGISDLGTYGLGSEAVTGAAWNNHVNTNGAFGTWPSKNTQLSFFNGLNPNQTSLSDTVKFNLPVCDLTQAKVDTSGCNGNVQCIWSTNMLCGCRGVKDWPYYIQPGNWNGEGDPTCPQKVDPYCKVTYNIGDSGQPQGCVGANCAPSDWIVTGNGNCATGNGGVGP